MKRTRAAPEMRSGQVRARRGQAAPTSTHVPTAGSDRGARSPSRTHQMRSAAASATQESAFASRAPRAGPLTTRVGPRQVMGRLQVLGFKNRRERQFGLTRKARCYAQVGVARNGSSTPRPPPRAVSLVSDTLAGTNACVPAMGRACRALLTDGAVLIRPAVAGRD